MEIKKNDKFTVTIEDMGEDGAGIGRVDGYIWFVKDALIGDTIEASAMKMKKNYGFARLVRVLTPAKGRGEAKCPVARACGGCQLQELDYKEQLKFKEKKVYNHLKRIGGMENLFLPEEAEQAAGVPDAVVMEPIIGMEDPWRYRNKAQYPIGREKDGKPTAGFFAGRTHSLIPVPELDCLLGCAENKDYLAAVLKFMEDFGVEPYDEANHKGLVRHVLLRKGFASGEHMVCLVINGKKLPHKKEFIERMREVGADSISLSFNMEKTNVILGTEIKNLYGPGYITDKIGNIEYRISPLSFYQVNPVQTERLYGTALEFADLNGGETVWDLYCGIGTISLFLAQKAKKVYGVEIVPEAIADAKNNAKINGIENAEFFVGKSEEVLPEYYEKYAKEHPGEHAHADVIVVDPPRKGCEENLLRTMADMQPDRIVYVSCDSATLARDLKILQELGYEVKKVRGVDQFPMTCHVETVVLLSHKKADSYIHIDVEFGEGEGKIPVDSIAKRAEAYKPKEKVTYKMIKEYIEAKYGFKVHTAYIAEVKRDLGLPMYDAPNAVEELKQPRKHPTAEKVEAIKDALKHFEVI